MKTDGNWIKTRDLSKDIETITEIPYNYNEEFFKITESVILHKILENIELLELRGESVRNKDFEIELPYLGSLIVFVDNDKNISFNFTARPIFVKKVKECILKKKDFLSEHLEQKLENKLVEKFIESEIL